MQLTLMWLTLCDSDWFAVVSGGLQTLPRDFNVVERECSFSRGLDFFVSFSCQQHDVAGIRLLERQRDCLSAIGLGRVFRSCFLKPDERVVDDCERIFRTWIVRSQHDKVASLPGGLAHQWALCAISISTA